MSGIDGVFQNEEKKQESRKICLTGGKSNLILDCVIVEGKE
ncbi:MAG: hypothetical protein SWH68_15405 [Thermodesulfobacteriota bacterium]|nr:hypothetical protein [Thermodesulfobacteriota bacterium]